VNITDFDLDPARLAPLRVCMDNYDIGDPNAEWPNNMISREAVAYGSGVIARKGIPVVHNVAPSEFALCKRLASEVNALMSGVRVGMGSEADDTFHELFIVANVDDPGPEKIDEALVRAKFGDTIFPLATITVEGLEEAGVWWSEVLYDASELDLAHQEGYLRPWRQMIGWFRAQVEFKDARFVRIGEYERLTQLDFTDSDAPPGTELPASVLPRLAIGLTKGGSIVGLFGYSVQT
jgi:hypothetical protein